MQKKAGKKKDEDNVHLKKVKIETVDSDFEDSNNNIEFWKNCLCIFMTESRHYM